MAPASPARRASRRRTRTSSPLRARHHRLPSPPRTTGTRALRRRRRSLDRSIARTRCGVTQARSAPPILHFRSFLDRSWSQEQQPHASAFRCCPPQATPTLPRLSVCLHTCMCYYCLCERSLPSPPPLQVRVRGARCPVSEAAAATTEAAATTTTTAAEVRICLGGGVAHACARTTAAATGGGGVVRRDVATRRWRWRWRSVTSRVTRIKQGQPGK